MLTEIPLLSNVRVAAPCSAFWDEMQEVEGDRVRFCEGCQKRVYNLSAMGQAEAEGLLRKHEGRLCVRYYRRFDGTILTNDCPVGMKAMRALVLKRVGATASLCAVFCLAWATNVVRANQEAPIAGRIAIPVQVTPMMGDVVTPVPEVEVGKVMLGGMTPPGTTAEPKVVRPEMGEMTATPYGADEKSTPPK